MGTDKNHSEAEVHLYPVAFPAGNANHLIGVLYRAADVERCPFSYGRALVHIPDPMAKPASLLGWRPQRSDNPLLVEETGDLETGLAVYEDLMTPEWRRLVVLKVVPTFDTPFQGVYLGFDVDLFDDHATWEDMVAKWHLEDLVAKALEPLPPPPPKTSKPFDAAEARANARAQLARSIALNQQMGQVRQSPKTPPRAPRSPSPTKPPGPLKGGAAAAIPSAVKKSK
jgi:hypothetical protein